MGEDLLAGPSGALWASKSLSLANLFFSRRIYFLPWGRERELFLSLLLNVLQLKMIFVSNGCISG